MTYIYKQIVMSPPLNIEQFPWLTGIVLHFSSRLELRKSCLKFYTAYFASSLTKYSDLNNKLYPKEALQKSKSTFSFLLNVPKVLTLSQDVL